jgi:hypothetical protein
MVERDFPIGHPAAADYDGSPYVDPHAIFGMDFPPGHPARDGKNVSILDTPDGMRVAILSNKQDLRELAAMRSLPPLVDPTTHEPVELSPEELAVVYAVRNSLSPGNAGRVTERYSLKEPPPPGAAGSSAALTAEQQALQSIIKRGFSPERAKELLDKYGVPDTLAELTKDSIR